MAATRKEQQALESRRRLVEAASRLFAERGYRDASVQAIGEAAGVSRGSIFWHFGSKEGLLLAVVEQAFARWETETLVPNVGEAVGLEAIGRGLDAHRAFLESEAGGAQRLFFVLFFEALGPRPELLGRFVELHAHLRALTAGWLRAGTDIRDDVDPDGAAAMLVGALGGVAYQRLANPELDLDATYGAMRETFVRGLAA
jgi:TetR/AcrR family acrAB operon transcriptional repressor